MNKVFVLVVTAITLLGCSPPPESDVETTAQESTHPIAKSMAMQAEELRRDNIRIKKLIKQDRATEK